MKKYLITPINGRSITIFVNGNIQDLIISAIETNQAFINAYWNEEGGAICLIGIDFLKLSIIDEVNNTSSNTGFGFKVSVS